MLGGSIYQTYAIKEAVRQGHYVISCDYLPNNPGHKFSHEYHNVSTTDKEAVLELARSLKVDGIVAYASDPAAPTAAYVCEKLGLPTSPFNSVEILSKKHLFRKFLSENGFNSPKSNSYIRYEDAMLDLQHFHLPVMVKPVDSSGSKGVNKLTDPSQLKAFFDDALSYSRDKIVLIEEFIVKKGPQISGDAFSVDGKLVFHCLGNEFYSRTVDKDFAPLGECWPSVMPDEVIDRLVVDLQRLISLLGMKSNAYNVEAIYGEDGKVYILELGARSGGSLIPQVISLATGVDLVKYVIKAALGDDCSDLRMAPVKGFWSNYMVHSNKTGHYAGVKYNTEFGKLHLVDYITDTKLGDLINRFRDAQDCVGELILRYSSSDEMASIIENLDSYFRVVVE